MLCTCVQKQPNSQVTDMKGWNRTAPFGSIPLAPAIYQSDNLAEDVKSSIPGPEFSNPAPLHTKEGDWLLGLQVHDAGEKEKAS